MAIHETTMKLGEQRGYPRWYSNGRYLERAGFGVGTAIELIPSAGSLVIRPASEDTGKHVHVHRRKPCIDLNQALLADVFGDAERLYVRVEQGRITLSVHPIERRERARPSDGSAGSLFSGIGMLDEAARQAGFTPTFAVESDSRACRLFAENHPDATVYEMSAEEALFDLPSVELLTMGIPCKPVSRNRTTKDGRERGKGALPSDHSAADLLNVALLAVLQVNPRTVVIENVPEFLDWEPVRLFQRTLARFGYHVQSRILNSGDYGALTRRERAVIVAQTPTSEGTVPVPWPTPRPCTQTLADIMDGAPDEGDWFDRSDRPGPFARSDRNRARGSGRHYRPSDATDTSVGTFTSEAGNCKIDEPVLAHPELGETYRYFTVSEGKRIMGLPETYIVPEALQPGWRYLGQGVVVGLFREVIGRASGRMAALRQAVRPLRAAVASPAPLFAHG